MQGGVAIIQGPAGTDKTFLLPALLTPFFASPVEPAAPIEPAPSITAAVQDKSSRHTGQEVLTASPLNKNTDDLTRQVRNSLLQYKHLVQKVACYHLPIQRSQTLCINTPERLLSSLKRIIWTCIKYIRGLCCVALTR